MSTPEDNVMDEHQPSIEEWQAFENRQNKNSVSMRTQVEHNLAHARRWRDYHLKFIGHPNAELAMGSKSFFNKYDMDIACYEAYLNQPPKDTSIPRDGTEILVHLESSRITIVKWDADMGVWEETAGDMAYPDSDIVRWSAIDWTPMPGLPGSDL